MDEVLENFRKLLYEHSVILQNRYQLEREEALRGNGIYTIFDKKAYESKIEDFINKKKYVKLWLSYYIDSMEYIRERVLPETAKAFFWRYIAPEIRQHNLDSINNVHFQQMIEQLEINDRFEEKLLLEYFLSQDDIWSLYGLVFSRSIENLIDDQLRNYLYKNDPRTT